MVKPRKGKIRRGARSTQKTGRPTVTESFRMAVLETAVAGAFPAVSVSPNSFLRGQNIWDNWDEYRCTRLRFRAYPRSTAPTSSFAFAFYPGVTTTVPALGPEIFENPTSSVFMLGQTHPSPWKRVSPKLLAGEQPWYKCEGSATNPDQIPGQILGASYISTTDVVLLELDATFQFRGEVDAANTPEARALYKRLHELKVDAAILKEQERIRRVLSYRPASSTFGFCDLSVPGKAPPFPTG